MKKALMLMAMILGTTAMVSAQAKPANSSADRDAKAAKTPTEVKQAEAEKAEPAAIAESTLSATPATEAVPVEAVKPVEENQKRSKK